MVRGYISLQITGTERIFLHPTLQSANQPPLQVIRRKQESKEQEHKPSQRCRREKEANPEDNENDRGNRQEEGAEVKKEPAQGNQQSAEYAGQRERQLISISSSIVGTSFLSFYLHFAMPAR